MFVRVHRCNNIITKVSMIEWYNGLTQSQQAWSLLLFALCTIGIVRCVWLCFRSWIVDIVIVSKYLNNAKVFARKFRSNANNGMERTYLIRKTDKVTHILGSERFSYPEIDIVSGIKYNTFYSPAEVDSLVGQLHATCLEWDEKRKNKRWYYLVQLLIPILFWLFRGIESILQFIAYLFKELGWNYNVEKKGHLITILSTLFAFITGMSSLLS